MDNAFRVPEPSGSMKHSHSLHEIRERIANLASEDNLAAVLIHMNDTYFIDERRDSGIPGMARLAGMAAEIRGFVRERVHEDRTLVLHSGDFLSPSAMSNLFQGEQMVDLLNLCGVNYATLGNHEFDFEK